MSIEVKRREDDDDKLHPEGEEMSSIEEKRGMETIGCDHITMRKMMTFPSIHSFIYLLLLYHYE